MPVLSLKDGQTDEFECLRMNKVAFEKNKEFFQIVLPEKLIRDASVECQCLLGLDEGVFNQKDTKRVTSCSSLVGIALRNQQVCECLVVCEHQNK